MESGKSKKTAKSSRKEEKKPASNKRNKESEKMEEVGEDSSEESENESDEEYVEIEEENEEIQIDFEGFDFKPNDFYSVKLLLTNYLEGGDFSANDLADLIIGQTGIGSILKAEHNEEDDSNFEEGFGIITAVNLHVHKEKVPIQQIKHFILSKVNDNSKKKFLKQLFEDESKPLGLLLNERMINVPAAVAPPLHRALFEDIQYALEDDPKAPYRFQNYILLGTTYESMENAKHQKKKAKSETETIYFRPEEEIYNKESVFSFTYRMANREDKKATLDSAISTSRTIMVVPASKMETILKKIDTLISGQ